MIVCVEERRMMMIVSERLEEFFFCVEEQERTLFSRKKIVRKQESCKEDVTVFISRNHTNLRVVTLRVEAGSRSPFPFGIASPWQ